ncbi:MFS transporter [Kitasatospora sp. NPDC048545]|uniref:MFS transporter n=1 Tax=Kitasatospora sp. NPDC048545 TaxID=3157208 RepID=UPI0033E5B3D6
MRGWLTPRRALASATLINMTGSGAYITGLTVFLVYARGISASAAAVCILIGTLGGKFGALLFGSVIDRVGGRMTYVSTKMVTGLAIAVLMAMSSPVGLTGCLLVYGLFSAVGGAARNLIIRDIAETDTKIYRAKLRSLANIGIVVGSGMGAAALAWNVSSGAVVCMALNAMSCLACAALVVVGVPVAADRSRPAKPVAEQVVPQGEPIWQLLAHPGLLRFLIVSAVFSLMTPVLTYAVPLWVSHYSYPHDAWPVGALVATNAVIVIVLQVPIGRLADRQARPEAVMVLAGLTLGLGLAAAGGSALVSGVKSLTVVWLAVVLVSIAEVLFAAATTELIFAPELKAYLSRTSALFNFASALGEAVGPTLLLVVVLHPAPGGWFAVAAVVWACALLYLRSATATVAETAEVQSEN